MLSRTTGALTPCVAATACLFSFSLAEPAWAGGFGLAVEVPGPSSGVAQDRDAVLIVRAMGCHGPGAGVSGKAEGLVDGKRISVPLHLEPIGNDTYLVKRQWVAQGTWVVSLSAKSRMIHTPKMSFRPVTNVLVEFAPDGTPKNVETLTDPRDGTTRQLVRARHLTSKDKAKEISAVLQSAAAPRVVRTAGA
jgi:hypothetical protein